MEWRGGRSISREITPRSNQANEATAPGGEAPSQSRAVDDVGRGLLVRTDEAGMLVAFDVESPE